MKHEAKASSPISDNAFSKWCAVIRERTNICLQNNQNDFLERRLRKRMNILSIDDFQEYYDIVVQEKRPREWQELLELLVNHESYFFRHLPSFKALKNFVLPELAARKLRQGKFTISMWSAGSSRGQEAYSMAMSFFEFMETANRTNEALLPDTMDVDILGTDINRTALMRAEKGEYSEQEIRNLPLSLRDKYLNSVDLDVSTLSNSNGKIIAFKKDTNRYRIKEKIRKKVHFQRLNFTDPESFLLPAKDIIFCQNVFVYFNKEDRAKTIAMMLSNLGPGGYLFPGPGESLGIDVKGASIERFTDTIAFKRNEEQIHVQPAR